MEIKHSSVQQTGPLPTGTFSRKVSGGSCCWIDQLWIHEKAASGRKRVGFSCPVFRPTRIIWEVCLQLLHQEVDLLPRVGGDDAIGRSPGSPKGNIARCPSPEPGDYDLGLQKALRNYEGQVVTFLSLAWVQGLGFRD